MSNFYSQWFDRVSTTDSTDGILNKGNAESSKKRTFKGYDSGNMKRLRTAYEASQTPSKPASPEDESWVDDLFDLMGNVDDDGNPSVQQSPPCGKVSPDSFLQNVVGDVLSKISEDDDLLFAGSRVESTVLPEPTPIYSSDSSYSSCCEASPSHEWNAPQTGCAASPYGAVTEAPQQPSEFMLPIQQSYGNESGTHTIDSLRRSSEPM